MNAGHGSRRRLTGGNFILLQRKFLGAGASATVFGFRWFLPSIWRYRRSLGHVLIASRFIHLFALVAPMFFQVVVDKVLAHRSYSTLTVLMVGLVTIGLFDVVLQYLRTYAFTHTTSRIDVELGRRLYRDLLILPLSFSRQAPPTRRSRACVNRIADIVARQHVCR